MLKVEMMAFRDRFKWLVFTATILLAIVERAAGYSSNLEVPLSTSKLNVDKTTHILDSLHMTVWDSTDCTDPLVCYLQNLVIHVPAPPCIAIPGSSDEFCISTLNCTNFQLTDFPSTFIPLYTVGVGIVNLGLQCIGDYAWGSSTGLLTATISQTSVNIDLLVDKNANDEYPSSTTFSSCDVDNIKVKLDFSGGSSFGQAVLNLLSKIILPFIDAMIKRLFCTEVSNYFATNVTNYVKNTLDPMLMELVKSPPSPVPLHVLQMCARGEYVNWQESFLGKMYSFLDHFIDSDRGKTFLGCIEKKIPNFSGDLMHPFIDSVVNFVTNGTGIIQHTFNPPHPLPRIASKVVNLTIESMTLSGMNSFEEISILRPSQYNNVSLLSTIRMKKMSAVFVTRANSSYVDGFSETFSMSMDLSNVTISVDMAAALDKKIFQDMFIEQLVSHPQCWLSSFGYFNVSSLIVDMNISDITISQLSRESSSTPLSNDLVALMNNVISLLTNGYNQLLTDVIKGAFQGPIRNEINKKITNMATAMRTDEDAGCPEHVPIPPSPPNLVVWSKNSGVQAIVKVVDMWLGADGINSVINCLSDNTGTFSFTVKDWEVLITGLNTFSNFSILDYRPFEANNKDYDLDNVIGLKNFIVKASNRKTSTLRSLMASLHMPTSALYSDPSYSSFSPSTTLVSLSQSLPDNILPPNSVITFSLYSFVFHLDLMIQENINKLLNLQTHQLQVNGCIDSTLEAAQISSLSMNLESAYLLITSDGRDKYDIDLSSLFRSFFDAFSSLLALQTLNNNIAHQLSSSSEVCAEGGVSPDSTDDTNPSAAGSNVDKADPYDLIYACVVMISAFFLTWFMYAWYQYKFGRGKLDDGNMHIVNDGSAGKRYGNSYTDENVTESHLQESPFIQKEQRFSWLCCQWYNVQAKEGQEEIEDYEERGINLEEREYESRVDGRSAKRIPATTLEAAAGSRCLPSLRRWGRRHWRRIGGSEMLLLNTRFPALLRFSLPFLIVGNIALFLYSNISYDAVSVIVNIHLGQEVITLPPVFNFGLAGTVTDMWNARVWLLAVLVAFFSGAWPYIKLFFMLLSLILPPKIFPISYRDAILKFMDAYGKYSLTDVYVMVLFICAFHLDLVLSPEILINVIVQPNFGCVGFLYATMGSLVLGHIVLNMHRIALSPMPMPPSTCGAVPPALELTTPLIPSISNEQDPFKKKEALCDHIFRVNRSSIFPLSTSSCEGSINSATYSYVNQVDDSYEGNVPNSSSSTISGQYPNTRCIVNTTTELDKNNDGDFVFLRLSKRGRICIQVTILITAVLVILGTYLDTITFTIAGLTGLLLGDDAVANYSFISIGQKVPVGSGHPHDFNVRLTALVYLAFGLGVPLCFLATNAVLWFVPMSTVIQQRVFVCVEIFSAWSALDVFAVAIIGSLFEIQQFAAFIVGDSCDAINVILAKYLDPVLHGEDVCFTVISNLIPSTAWLVFLASLCLMAIAVPSLAIAEVAVEDRKHILANISSSAHGQCGSENENLRRKSVQPAGHNNTKDKGNSCSSLFLRMLLSLKLVDVCSTCPPS